MTVTQCPADQELVHFVLGRMSEPKAVFLESHIEQCPNCLEKLDAIKTQDTVLDLLRSKETLSQPDVKVVQSLVEKVRKFKAAKRPV